MASRFWVGGTGTWDSTTTTHWSATTGGAGGATAPVTGDTVTFDGNSGASAVITVDTTINGLSLATINMAGLVGTLDFSVNNPSITLTASFLNAGSAVRTLNLGSGTFTISGANGTIWDCSTSTNLTLNAGTSTLLFNGTPAQTGATRTIALGSTAKSYNTITVTNGGSTGPYMDINGSAAITIATLNLTPPVNIRWANSGTITITNAINWAGTSFSNAIELIGQATVAPTISVAAGSVITWAALSGLTFAGSAANATNSFDMKGNNMNGGGISGPSGGTGSHMIGG